MLCTCGHQAGRHEHGFHREKSYCGSCWCPRYRRWFWWRKYRPVGQYA